VHIRKRKNAKGEWRYQAVIHRDNGFVSAGTFRARDAAERAGRIAEGEIEVRGLPKTRRELQRKTVGDIFYEFKGYVINEDNPDDIEDDNLTDNQLSIKLRLSLFGSYPIFCVNLSDVSKQDAEGYRDERLRQVWKPHNATEAAKPKRIAPSTVRKEIGLIKKIFDVAAKHGWSLPQAIPLQGSG
jgi:hypothetical protein